jgi:hypothetical protein
VTITLLERIAKKRPKKLLAIDGGGIRGILALEILAQMEADLRDASRRPDYVLADYFDAIGGTSTGAIIAAGLSFGLPVKSILDFYLDSGGAMFRKTNLLNRLRYKFDSEPLAVKIRMVFDEETLGSDRLRTLLLLVLRNASTDSPWPLINNPFGTYNQASHPGCNQKLPLWRLLRASSAAPTYFPPEVVDVGDQNFVFVDGGVTMYNNPAFQLFLMMTVDAYWRHAPPELRQGWAVGTEEMLLVSVGTGTSPGAKSSLSVDEMNLLYNASTIPGALMASALAEQDSLCRIFGECVYGDRIDRELGTLAGSKGPLTEKLFRYVRYNAELSRGGLQAIGCSDVEPTNVQRMDSVVGLDDLRKVGRAVAKEKVRRDHLLLDIFKP